MSASPTERTMVYLRKFWSIVEKTEHWNQYSRRRNDLFGFIDVLAMENSAMLAVQATSTSNMGARVKKILASDKAWHWIQDYNRRIVVMGWKKYTKPVAGLYWRPTFKELFKRDFVQARGKRQDGDRTLS